MTNMLLRLLCSLNQYKLNHSILYILFISCDFTTKHDAHTFEGSHDHGRPFAAGSVVQFLAVCTFCIITDLTRTAGTETNHHHVSFCFLLSCRLWVLMVPPQWKSFSTHWTRGLAWGSLSCLGLPSSLMIHLAKTWSTACSHLPRWDSGSLSISGWKKPSIHDWRLWLPVLYQAKSLL